MKILHGRICLAMPEPPRRVTHNQIMAGNSIHLIYRCFSLHLAGYNVGCRNYRQFAKNMWPRDQKGVPHLQGNLSLTRALSYRFAASHISNLDSF